jgi:adenosylmethionine-8-amino-7-oxononanoate aminotransferase
MDGDSETLVARDRASVWHPYSSMLDAPSVFPVVSASGVRIRLVDGTELIDGMASWWCAIHGYNHPALNRAITEQLESMAHVMFGGLTHEPAVRLAEKLIEITPTGLDIVFFSDSGSVATEVAIKMAIQYQAVRGRPGKRKLVTVRGGYHGDTFGAMAVCDPVTGMHSLFKGVLTQHYFADRPKVRFSDHWDKSDTASLVVLVEQHHDEIAALILEPIMQGAGGIWFYHPEYLRAARTLCDDYDLLLIADEIATGFGRSGKLFACEHSGIAPDILCLGKALTGGYVTLAATLATGVVAEAISDHGRGTFMHGPTFMANPLACAVAYANVELLLSSDWHRNVSRVEQQLRSELEPCRRLAQVADVRVLGGLVSSN